MWLHEIDQATQEERDALARRIYTSLCEVWCRQNGLELKDVKVERVTDPADGGKIYWIK